MFSSILNARIWLLLAGIPLLPSLGLSAADAQPWETMEQFKEESILYPEFVINNLWILMAAALVFLMHLGFASLEAGLTRQKNTVNILFKNVFVISIGILTYGLCGFAIMYPDGWLVSNWLGFGLGIGFDSSDPVGMLTPAYGADMTIWADFIFQAMFAATAATIVSGAVAERIKLSSFMVFTVLLLAISYPITGSWLWGGGWLAELGFYDFAGSTLVHAVGGAAALACVFLLGPRNGKYLSGGRVHPLLGHNMPLAAIGVFLLWLGWFGFNGGSVLSADPAAVSFVFVTTALAAASGALASMLFSWALLKTPDLTMSLNGVLAGLVGITAGADVISPLWSVVVGAIAGIIVVLSVIFFDKIRIDDPVGAISVHGICGIWGTVAVGIFAPGTAVWWVQLLGSLSIIAFTLLFALVVFSIIRVIHGVRVSAEEEETGLDQGEHAQEAYPDFGKVTS